MKIKKLVEEFVDVDLEEIVDNIYNDSEFWLRNGWEEAEDCILTNIAYEDYEFTDEEERQILESCKKRFDLEYEEAREKELKTLSNREEVLNWIDSFDRDETDEGDIGYVLSPETILDTILKNAKTLSK